ncbi:hypothetical protein LTR17_001710 [Elasticomyces elasticus]|nr:hypothetical protein LTR17_001710 [Elasticomyces elasticus]
MKAMQRKVGALTGKRKEDQADVGVVLAEFKEVDDMLTKLVKDLTAFRNSWDDILKLQYDLTEAVATLYKPLDPANDPEQRRAPTVTPQTYIQKCLGLQKLYSDLKTDLYTELNLIDTKLIRPAEEAKAATKGLGKTLKHRENCKLDYERYLSRAEHVRRKETRSIKEESALAAHESNLAQAQIDYETADDQVKQTFPPVTAAVASLIPYLAANQVMLQTTLVGQLYTVMDKYTRAHQMANPAPDDAEIVRVWESEYTGFRKELESGIGVIANGKAVQRTMTLPVDKGSTLTGLGIRNKAGGMMGKGNGSASPSGEGSSMTGMGIRNKAGGLMHKGGSGSSTPASGEGSSMTGLGIRNKAGGLMNRQGSPASHSPAVPASERPRIGQRQSSGTTTMSVYDDAREHHNDDYEAAPTKPPRPGGNSPGLGMPSPTINFGSKPGRIPSTSASTYSQPAGDSVASWQRRASPPSDHAPPPSYEQAAATAVNGATHKAASDYFGRDSKTPAGTNSQHAAMASSLASSAMSAAAAKKKPPPPKPAKRMMSGQHVEYVTAIYDFDGQNDGDLAFREGDRIQVVHKTESVDDWWEGEVRGKRGSFPANYVKL